jgi:uncharacterized membrane protein YdbT with pleckstrin-like domain
MIERYIFVKLKEEYATEDGRAEAARHTRAVISELPGVVAVRVGTPSDDRSAKAWDLSIAVRFQSAEDIEPYRVHPDHRAYVDEFLEPRMDVIKAWNFAVE